VNALSAAARQIQHVVTRATPAPVLVRCAIFLTALAGLLLAFPAELLVGRQIVVLPLLALWPAVAPRGHGATVAALVTVGGWVAATSWYGEPVRLLPLVTIAALLYAGHSLTALAAVLPYDVIVSVEALARWLSRTILVVVFAAVLAVLLLGAADLGGRGALAAASVLGVAVALGLAALLAWLLRRR
jgi:hypothetical protein